MIVIVILGIMLSIAAPAFRNTIMNNRITSNANEFATALSLARIEAIKNGYGTVIVATTGGSSNEWGNGFVVSIWTNTDYDSDVDSGEIGAEIKRIAAFNDQIQMDSVGNITQISFLDNGEFNSASAQTFTLCDSRTGETGRQFTLSLMGKFALDREFSCP